jgi:uncharacterized protein YxjI
MKVTFHETWRNQSLLSFHDRFWIADSQSEFTYSTNGLLICICAQLYRLTHTQKKQSKSTHKLRLSEQPVGGSSLTPSILVAVAQ